MQKTAGMMTAVGFLILIIYLFVPKVKQYQQYQQTLEKLEDDVAVLQSQITEMQKNGRNLQHDKNYAKRIAHEHGLVEEGEVIYRFLDEPAP